MNIGKEAIAYGTVGVIYGMITSHYNIGYDHPLFWLLFIPMAMVVIFERVFNKN